MKHEGDDIAARLVALGVSVIKIIGTLPQTAAVVVQTQAPAEVTARAPRAVPARTGIP